MATHRQRGDRHEFIIRKRPLEKPVSLYFDDFEAGREWCENAEAWLAQGVIPEVLQNIIDERKEKRQKSSTRILASIVREYLSTTYVKDNDVKLLNVSVGRFGKADIVEISSYDWAESLVTRLKREHNLVPGTIRHHVGALARCLDWALKKHYIVSNPLRMLPRGYSNYTPEDEKYVEKKEDSYRDYRIEEDKEEVMIRKVLEGGYRPPHKQRPLELKHRKALILMFDLALETAMRMRELFTIGFEQINYGKKTIYLTKTKNGDVRQIPMSSVAIKKLKAYMKETTPEERGPGDCIFPWWDGIPQQKSLNKTTSDLSRQWGRIFDHAGYPKINFHDTRHEGTCRLYLRTDLSDLEISRITGHRSLQMLRRYASLRGSDLAGRLW